MNYKLASKYADQIKRISDLCLVTEQGGFPVAENLSHKSMINLCEAMGYEPPVLKSEPVSPAPASWADYARAGQLDRAMDIYCSRFGRDAKREDAKAIIEDFLAADAPAAKPDKDGWIDWKGGECPVKAGTFGRVRTRDGYEFQNALDLNETDLVEWWMHESDPDNHIIAYRLTSVSEGV